jgi:hypothetical protein
MTLHLLKLDQSVVYACGNVETTAARAGADPMPFGTAKKDCRWN